MAERPEAILAEILKEFGLRYAVLATADGRIVSTAGNPNELTASWAPWFIATFVGSAEAIAGEYQSLENRLLPTHSAQ